MNNNKVVEIKDIKKYFPLRGGGRKNKKYVKAVDGITLDVYEGETLGLVGESGSGKTTLAKMILGLLPPTENTVLIDGNDIWKDKKTKGRGKEVNAVFQDPASSLNPRSTIYRTLERPLLISSLPGLNDAKRPAKTGNTIIAQSITKNPVPKTTPTLCLGVSLTERTFFFLSAIF